jgi:hypothetical protein
MDSKPEIAFNCKLTLNLGTLDLTINPWLRNILDRRINRE